MFLVINLGKKCWGNQRFQKSGWYLVTIIYYDFHTSENILVFNNSEYDHVNCFFSYSIFFSYGHINFGSKNYYCYNHYIV